MVHRAPDSRLLTNLILDEKEYAKHLAGLFPLSHSALASLSAYAAASPSHPSSPAQSIAAVVDVLASANDALQRYKLAIEAWREQLVCLKDLEDDLAAVLRDRDILVTRLIRASKSTREAHRSSRLIAPLTSLGSSSLSSLPSTNTTPTGSGLGPASTNSKLAQAQAELQACEAHLVAKEHELDAQRVSIAREGLGARCRALIDCGWVWGEMGKQGLKALQALDVNGATLNDHTASTSAQPRLGVNSITHASDNSSLTPSQSASQTAARSVETSHEASASKDHEHTEIMPELEIKSGLSASQARAVHTEEEGDLTVTLPPAHAISELAIPTGVRSQRPLNGDLAVQRQAAPTANSAPAVAPGRKRASRPPRRPPSQHITEASDEGSDGPSSISNRDDSANPAASATFNLFVPRTVFPSTSAVPGTYETSSEDDHAAGPLEVVENDPFEVIRKSMFGPSSSVPLLPASSSGPSGHTNPSDARVGQVSPSKQSAFPILGLGSRSALGIGLPSGSGSTKRERRTSTAFLGSIRGLFRKPKDRDKAATDWDDGHSSPTHSSPNRAKARVNGKGKRGWVTRTDARIKRSRNGREDSDEEATPTGTVTPAPVVKMSRQNSGARLRKGRPGASPRGIHENGSSASVPAGPSHHAGGADGWITDSPVVAGTGPGVGASSGQGGGMNVGHGKLRTRRGMTKRGKTSVADLRGSDQGHTDGEVDDRGADKRRSLERVVNKASDASASEPKSRFDTEEKKELIHRGTIDTVPTADSNVSASASSGVQHRRAATASVRKTSPGGTLMHRRSASLSVIHTHVTSESTTMQGPHPLISTGRTTSWRKPPPQLDSPFQLESVPQPQTPSRTQTESQPRQSIKRHLGNGHATHAFKHAQNQSLMSIVANVTRLNDTESQSQDQDQDRAWLGVGVDRARSLDIPRAPGSVLREVDRDVNRESLVGTVVNSRGHARLSSSSTAADEDGHGGARRVGQEQGQGQGQGAQHPIKFPLRSALRNASRTPSPSPAPAPARAPVTVPAVTAVGDDREAKKAFGAVQVDVALAQAEEDRKRKLTSSSLRDSASISSYETGKETLDAEEVSLPPLRSQSQPPPVRSYSPPSRSQLPTPRSRTPPPPPLSFTFPPPPAKPPPVSATQPVRDEVTYSNPSLDTTEQAASSNASTETPPVRRKSVRVSLPPTFSPTPPALYDEDGEYAPWSTSKSFSMRDEREGEGEKEKERGGRPREREKLNPKKGRKRGGGGGVQEDMWADSSEEDETYRRAKRLLSLAGKPDGAKEDKGKVRAKT